MLNYITQKVARYIGMISTGVAADVCIIWANFQDWCVCQHRELYNCPFVGPDLNGFNKVFPVVM